MRNTAGLLMMAVIGFACAGCVAAYPPEPVFSAVSVQPLQDPNCRQYAVQVQVAGKPEEINGRACRQADGTWRIAEQAPGQTEPVVVFYVPPPQGYYDPWLWDAPIGFSLGASVVFVDHSHRLHRFRFPNRSFAFHNDGFRFSQFHHGFAGFHGGFGGMGGRRG